MRVTYKLDDIEVTYAYEEGQTRVSQDKELMDFTFDKFLEVYKMKKELIMKTQVSPNELLLAEE